MKDRIYKHTSTRMSQAQLSKILYWCIMLDVIITCTHTLGKSFNRKQNAFNTAWLALGFKDAESLKKFEAETQLTLDEPPKAQLN